MKVLVIGQDGHAHALTWKLFNSALASEIICAPGNGGTSQVVPSIALEPDNAAEIASWAFAEQIDIIVPTSSAPLYAGLVDEVLTMHVGVFGPPQRAARITQSRCAAKEFLLRHRLPVPQGHAFSNLGTAEKYLATRHLPLVLKADHPAVGGGTFTDRYSALEALRRLFTARPVEGHNDGVVIETFHPGIHLSFSALTDGSTALPLLPTRVYSRLHEGDFAPYAPGMGAHTGTSTYARKLQTYLHQQLIMPIVNAMQRENLPYWGVLGIDCVVTDRGPLITGLRCNMRDMEAQVVLPRLEDDLLALIQATISRRLDQLAPLQWRDEASVGIALVSHGYPNHFPVGNPITISDIEPGVLVFHDQTANPLGMEYRPAGHRGPPALSKLIMGLEQPGPQIVTMGGHVLTVVALGATLQGARGRALINAERISFSGSFYRDDIGKRDFR
jgi:phosphoribosylamine--glycine ligase